MAARSAGHTRDRFLQFGLRTLLLAVLLFAGTISIWRTVCKYRSASLWRNLEEAQSKRDAAQQGWKLAHEKVLGGVEGTVAEQKARDEYFAARKKVENAKTVLWKFYDVSGKKVVYVKFDATSGTKILVSEN
jgi:hypothetical protein